MKIVIVLLAVCFVGVFGGKITKEQEQLLKPIRDDCLKQTNTELALVEEIKKTIKYDEKANCFSACMFKSLGMMSEEGGFEEDVVRALLSTNIEMEPLNKAIDKCKTEVGKDHCETAGKLVQCFMNNGAVISQ